MTELVINLIQSDDYKKRLLGEYLELKERYEKLHKFLIKCEAGALTNKDTIITTNEISLLEKQCNLMGNYLKVLEIRMEIEGISSDGLEVRKW